MARTLVKMVLWTVLGATLLFGFSSVSDAGTVVRYVRRGIQYDFYIDPGSTYILYYYPDGRTATVLYKQSIVAWWSQNPYNSMSVYVSSNGWNWYPMYVNQYIPFWWNSIWLGIPRGGVYKMVIVNQRGSAVVHVLVQ